MHQILIRKVTFSNLFAYGNGKHEVRFDKAGLTWVRGANGAGKSTVIEALTFVFFGSAYRKAENGTLQLKKLLNTANKTGKLVVEVEFERIDSTSHKVYVLTRQLTRSGTSSFKYKSKDYGSEEFSAENKGAGTTQKKIEGEILGFNKNIFENVISLNTIQRDPIIEMKPAAKRKLIEAILTLSIDKFKDMNGKALKQAQTKFDASTSDVEKYMKDVEELQVITKQMEKERENDINDLLNDLTKINSDIEENTSVQKNIQDELNVVVIKGKTKKAESDTIGDIETKIADLGEIKVLIPQLHEDETKLVEATESLNVIRTKYTEMEDVCNALGQNELTKRFEEIKSDLLTHNATVSTSNTMRDVKKESMDSIHMKATELNSGVPCDTCGKPSTEDDIKKIKDSYRIKWIEHNKEYTRFVNKIETSTVMISTLEIERDEIEARININIKTFDEMNDYWGLTVQSADFTVSSIESDIKDKRAKISKCDIISVEQVENDLLQLELDKVYNDTLTVELSTLRTEMSTLNERISGMELAIDILNTERNTLSDKIERKRNTTSHDSFTATKHKLTGAEHDLDTARNRVDKYSDQVAINQYIAGMYGDDGIKKLVLGIFVPNLNKAIAANLIKFNLPYTLQFSDSMDMEFSSRFGMADSYYGLSEGQKRKINFAVALSLRDFVTSIADFKINVLFLDEVLDISTDPEAYIDMVSLLKDNISIIGNVYMITHRGDLVKEYFDNCLEFTYDGRYSSIAEVDLSKED